MTVSQVALESLRWYVILSVFAWLMYPYIFRAMASLPSKGIPFVRPLGLLLAALVPWWLSAIGLTRYTTRLIVVIPVGLAIALWIREAQTGDIRRGLATAHRQLVAYELTTVLLFVGYVAFRCYNPAIQHTEKPMELTFLTRIVHTQSMPPPDPWFLGHSINYYYLGYLLMAIPARLARIAPSHAFNLALATLFATSAVAAAGVAADLVMSRGVRSRRVIVLSGALAGIFLLGVGNLVTPIEFIQHPLRTLQTGWWQGIGWNSSRVITDGPNRQTINEFPAFSFVLGDLHPHLLDYPMFLSSIGIGLALALAGHTRRLFYAAALGGAVAAATYATNSWDMPPAMFLAVAGIMIATRGLSWRARVRPLALLALGMVGVVFPFWIHYIPAVGLHDESVPTAVRTAPILGKIVDTIGVVTWPRTSTWEIFKVHGLFLVILALYLASMLTPMIWTRRITPLAFWGTLAGLFAMSILTRFPGLFWFIGPAVLCGGLVLTVRSKAADRYHLILVGLAFALLSITEVFFVQDAFGDRMNTVFKLYFQVWALFAIAAAVALPVAVAWLHANAGRYYAMVAGILISLVVVGAALYPPISAYRWTSGFSQFTGVDGLNYLQRYAPDETAAVAWLSSHSSTSDHILEAPGCSYGEDGALPDNVFSMATGLSTPLGWQFHEYQWRLGVPTISTQIDQRKADVKTIYDAPASIAAQRLLNQYDIRYIIVGPIERYGYGTQCDGGAPYSPTGLAQLSQIGWPLVFRNTSVMIYERPR